MNLDPLAVSKPQGATDQSIKARLLKGTQADYAPAPDFPGKNVSGLLPLGPNVLVRVDTCAEQSAGGVFLTQDKIDNMDQASESGVIYAIGKTAWRGYDADERPKLGDRVYFQRYSGLTGTGREGGRYRIMEFTCIACLVDVTADELMTEVVA